MSKHNQNNNEIEEMTKTVCCQKCGTGLELVNGIVPLHKVQKSLQGSRAGICRGSNAKVA
jgi:hypothetical protein